MGQHLPGKLNKNKKRLHTHTQGVLPWKCWNLSEASRLHKPASHTPAWWRRWHSWWRRVRGSRTERSDPSGGVWGRSSGTERAQPDLGQCLCSSSTHQLSSQSLPAPSQHWPSVWTRTSKTTQIRPRLLSGTMGTICWWQPASADLRALTRYQKEET